eukprot:460856_1
MIYQRQILCIRIKLYAKESKHLSFQTKVVHLMDIQSDSWLPTGTGDRKNFFEDMMKIAKKLYTCFCHSMSELSGDSVHLKFDFWWQTVLTFLDIRCIYSSFIPLSNYHKDYFQRNTHSLLLKQLIEYDFPLLFLLYPQTYLELQRTHSVNHSVYEIYTDFLVKVQGHEESWLTEQHLRVLSTEQIEDIQRECSLKAIIKCGGVRGIQNYINHISKIKGIGVNSLYVVPVSIHLSAYQAFIIRTFDKVPQRTKNKSLSYNKPIIVQHYWIKTAMEHYLSLFDIDGSILDNNSIEYVAKFRVFLLENVAANYHLIEDHRHRNLMGVLETEIVQQFDDGMLLFKRFFLSLFDEDECCVPNACINTINIDRHMCFELESVILETIIAASNRNILLKCYDDLCDKTSDICFALSRLNKHLILCWTSAQDQDEYYMSAGIHLTQECIDDELGQQIVTQYCEVLYRNFECKQRQTKRISWINEDDSGMLFGVKVPNTKNPQAQKRWMGKIQRMRYAGNT